MPLAFESLDNQGQKSLPDALALMGWQNSQDNNFSSFQIAEAIPHHVRTRQRNNALNLPGFDVLCPGLGCDAI